MQVVRNLLGVSAGPIDLRLASFSTNRISEALLRDFMLCEQAAGFLFRCRPDNW